ncbi:MAG TPA: right-handed parallel beta-helix repeat-containing protein, partial [Pseudolysinimonas sp.]|nr:right-handed parallel beta-helix repeat-containing protein [Pseudolysinimonas sp.]
MSVSPHARRPRLTALAVSLATAVALALLPALPAQAATTLTASPTGVGTSCSATAPCSVGTALSKARAGDVVVLRAGTYGAPLLTGTGGTTTAPIRVRPATGAIASFVKLQTYLPNVTWSGLTVTTLLYVYPQAVNTVIENFTMAKSGSFLRANGTVVRNSVFTGGLDLDAVQIKDATGVTLEGNIIRDYRLSSATSTAHVDCVQVFDTAQVRIVRNSISGCSNAGIILSPGVGQGIRGIEISGNFIQGCIVVSTTCKGGSALDVREATATDVVVRNNSIVDGATRVVPRSGLVFDRNVVSYLADCTAPITGSVVQAWNSGACATPARLGVDGNRQGTVAFVNRPAGDLHVADTQSFTIDALVAALSSTPVLGRDGTLL